jgi:hypothetical protein
MKNSVYSQYRAQGVDSKDHTLGEKLAKIGQIYLERYPTPEYFGPFYFHTNQLQAKLLTKLTNVTNDEQAIPHLIAILYALPKSGDLSNTLIHCISTHPLPDAHSLKDGKHNTYFDVIREQDIDSSGGLIKSIGNALFKLMGFGQALTQAPTMKEETTTTDIAQSSLADRLAYVGEKYLKAHPHETSTLFFFNRHTNQRQAHLLTQIKGLSTPEAYERATQLLAGLSKGELSQAIIAEVSKDYHNTIVNSVPKIERIGTFERQFSEAMLIGMDAVNPKLDPTESRTAQLN